MKTGVKGGSKDMGTVFVGPEPKCVREARERAEMDAERRLDGVRFVWFFAGVLAAVAAMLAVVFA